MVKTIQKERKDDILEVRNLISIVFARAGGEARPEDVMRFIAREQKRVSEENSILVTIANADKQLAADDPMQVLVSEQLHWLLAETTSLCGEVDGKLKSIAMLNSLRVSSSTQCLAIMQDHTPFDFRISSLRHLKPDIGQSSLRSQALVCECMSQIFNLRDRLQLAVRVLK